MLPVSSFLKLLLQTFSISFGRDEEGTVSESVIAGSTLAPHFDRSILVLPSSSLVSPRRWTQREGGGRGQQQAQLSASSMLVLASGHPASHMLLLRAKSADPRGDAADAAWRGGRRGLEVFDVGGRGGVREWDTRQGD